MATKTFLSSLMITKLVFISNWSLFYLKDSLVDIKLFLASNWLFKSTIANF